MAIAAVLACTGQLLAGCASGPPVGGHAWVGIRLAINPVVGGIEPGLSSTLRAYELIPDWRERGLRNNYKKIELPPELRGRYRIVQGSYDIAC